MSTKSTVYKTIGSQKDDLLLTRGMKYLPEKELLKGNNISDVLGMAHANYSRISLIGNDDIHLGDMIQVRIHLFDGYGQRRSVGGDYLRLWMENKQLKASVSGEVFDHNNGCYTGYLRALWVGKATIRVFIARRREEIALYYTLYRDYGSIWTGNAKFRNGTFQETTRCSTARPNVIERPWCNYTLLNDGFPWFCEKPGNLSCDTWHQYNSQRRDEINMTPQERALYAWTRTVSEDILPNAQSIQILKGKVQGNEASQFSQASIPCNKLPPKSTWQRESPNGFFYKGRWQQRLCRDTLSHNTASYRECLRDKTLWLPGDSTSAQVYEITLNILKMPFSKGIRNHSPMISHNKEYKFTVKWQAHELPFFHGNTRHNPADTIAEHTILDSLPNTTEDIVVLYLYSHVVLLHPDVFRQHVQRLAFSARNLLNRAPMVTLAVRGPHVFYRTDELGLLSYWGLIFADILREEFSSIKEKVFYLDFWDMGVAEPCYDVHCPPMYISQIVHNMMSYLCFRTHL